MAVPYPIINDTPPRTQVIAGLNQTVYSTNWTANVASDILVYDAPPNLPSSDILYLVNPNNYSVSFIGDGDIVQVTFVTAPTQFDVITIVRNTPADRLNLYTNTNFTPSMLNSDFGTLTLVDQQDALWQQICPAYNYSAIINYPIDLVLPVLGANEFWAKNDTNTAFIPVLLNTTSDFAPNSSPFVLTAIDALLPESSVITAGAGINITISGGNVIISSTGESVGWIDVTTTPFQMVAEGGYTVDDVSLVTFTLPTVAAYGTGLSIININTGGFTINFNAGQSIRIGSIACTTSTGSLSSTAQGDSINLICTVANTVWTAVGGPQGCLAYV